MQTNFSELLKFISQNIDTFSSNLVPLWHPLGFVSCVIEDIPSNNTIRLHYWPKGMRRVKNPDWPIHTHSYTLNSLILRGKVRNLQYRTVSGVGKWIYLVNYFEGGSEIIRTEDETQVIIESDEVRYCGEQYQVPRGTFHQTHVPINEIAVTIVVLSDYSEEHPKVLGDYKLSKKYPYDRIPFDQIHFWNEVREALNLHLSQNNNL